MSPTLDSRIPVILAPADRAGAEDAVLREGAGGSGGFTPATPTGHASGCTCCAARTPAGRALAELLQGRARGQVPFFRRVVVDVVSLAGRREVEVALARDPVASSCYRLIA